MKQNATVIAPVIWRLSEATLKHMRNDKFTIEVGGQYLAVMREVAVFLINVADRFAYRLLAPEARAEFSTALAIRLAEIFDENETALFGPPESGTWKGQFIELFNMRSSDYADFGHDEKGPDFRFVRYLGTSIEHLLGPEDRIWTVDQITQIEAPEAVKTLKKALDDLFASPGALPDTEVPAAAGSPPPKGNE
jgi:hypothetical protein